MSKRAWAGLIVGVVLIGTIIVVGSVMGHNYEGDTLKRCWTEDGEQMCETYVPETSCERVTPIPTPTPTPVPVPNEVPERQEEERPAPVRPSCPAMDVNGDGIPELGHVTVEGYCYWTYN